QCELHDRALDRRFAPALCRQLCQWPFAQWAGFEKAEPAGDRPFLFGQAGDRRSGEILATQSAEEKGLYCRLPGRSDRAGGRAGYSGAYVREMSVADALAGAADRRTHRAGTVGSSLRAGVVRSRDELEALAHRWQGLE